MWCQVKSNPGDLVLWWEYLTVLANSKKPYLDL